jgi:general secretion pathway protein J
LAYFIAFPDRFERWTNNGAVQDRRNDFMARIRTSPECHFDHFSIEARELKAMNRISEQRQSGFTLLEVLMALVVAAALMMALVRGVQTGLTFWNAQNRLTSETEDLNSVAWTLRVLLTEIPTKPMAAPTGTESDAPAAVGIHGKSDALSFVGDLATGLGQISRSDILVELRDRRMVLAWRPHIHATVDSPRPMLDETTLILNVDQLEFAYWGEPQTGAAPIWLATWKGPKLPGLIRVRVTFGRGDLRRWPDLIVAPRLAAMS